MQRHVKKHLVEIHCIYLGNKEMCCILGHAAQALFLLSTKCHLFNNFVFFYSNNMLFINHMLKVNTNLLVESLNARSSTEYTGC
jgi:hypothetical protein